MCFFYKGKGKTLYTRFQFNLLGKFSRRSINDVCDIVTRQAYVVGAHYNKGMLNVYRLPKFENFCSMIWFKTF